MVGVDVSRRDEDEEFGARSQRGHGAFRLSRLARQVDRDVPGLARNRFVGTSLSSVSAHERYPLWRIAGEATRQAGHLVAQPHSGARDAPPQPRRSPQHQNPHDAGR